MESNLCFNTAKTTLLIMLPETPLTGSEALTQALQFFAGNPTKPLLVILGPTASGKTDFSINLSKALQAQDILTEVVNADSRQFYRLFDIGTAKIKSNEMQGIPHHLLSVLNPDEPCSIAWFQEQATRIIADIHARGAVPMLVGGSMLYISALIDGFLPIPVDEELRTRLSDAYDADDGVTLMKRLQEVDPVSAATIPVENKVYLVRALEMYESTGKPKSEEIAKTGTAYDLLMFGILRDREELKRTIVARTKAMLAGGWIEEVQLLRAQGHTSDEPAMESHGYREISAAIDRGDLNVEKLAEDISRQTQRYAKRSMTWWQRDDRVHWVTL